MFTIFASPLEMSDRPDRLDLFERQLAFLRRVWNDHNESVHEGFLPTIYEMNVSSTISPNAIDWKVMMCQTRV